MPRFESLWQGQTVRLEQELVRRDGRRFWARLTGRAVDPRQPDQGVVWVIDDITEEHRASEALAAAKALAEQSDRAKTQFLANVGHEFRTPMNAVLGMAYLAQQTDLNPRQREYLQRIQASGQQLMGLINDILDYAKLEAGGVHVVALPFDLMQLLDALCSTWRPAALDKGLALDCDLPPQLPRWLVGDAQRLTQVIGQGLSNALKFTERGGVTVRVSASAVDAGALWDLRIEIEDTGVGMTQEQLARLFRRFEQGDGSSTRAFGGVGLGLVIARGLAALMGGEVSVRSTPGQGSVFCLRLRLPTAAEQDLSVPATPAPLPAAAPVDLRPGMAPSAAADDTQARDWAGRLLQLVAAGDAEAVQCLQAGAAPLAQWLGQGDFALLRNALQGFDFERAQAVLQQALGR